MKKVFGIVISIALMTSITGCGGRTESSAELPPEGFVGSEDSGGSSVDDELARIMAEHPDAEVVTEDDGTILITYYDPDRVVVTKYPDGTGSIAYYGPDLSKENFPSYDEVQAEYPGKTVLVWAIEASMYERRAPFRTREVNEYLDEQGCEYAVCFKPVNYDFNGDNYPTPSLAAFTELINSEQVDLLSPYGYDEYVFNGLYECLDEYLETDSGQKLYGAFPEKLWEGLKINGDIYGVSGTNTLSFDWGYFVNAELAEKYGYDITKPISEQLDILKAVKANEKGLDVFAIYSDDISGYTGNTNVKYISSGVYWNSETHTAECALDDPVYMDRLRLYDTVKKTKSDNKSVFKDISFNWSKNFFIEIDSVAGGSVGYDGVKTVEVEYGENTVTAIPVFREQTMVRHAYAATGIYSKSAHKEAAFELLAKVFSDPVLNNLLVYGIEGEDYVLENGTASEPVNPGNILRFANPMICHRCNRIPFTAEKFAEIYESAGVYEDIDFVLDPRDIADELNAEITAADNLRLSEVTSLDDVLAEYREGLYKAGLQTIIDECNRQYEVYKNEKD